MTALESRVVGFMKVAIGPAVNVWGELERV